MPRKASRAELEEQIRQLQPYQEAFFCLMQGLKPIQVHSCDVFVTVVGMERAPGGVIIGVNGEGCAVQWISDVMARWAHGGDPYFREIASKLSKLQVDYLEKREEYLAKRRAS